MSSENNLWPFLLFLPTNRDRRHEFIKSVLSSRVAESVLSSFNKDGIAFQRDLVEQLPHSNKSILSYIKTLQMFGLLKSRSTVRRGKRVVYHELTRSGWGIARFFSEGLPSDIDELTVYLLEDYLMHIISLYQERRQGARKIFDIFTRTRAKTILEGSQTYEKPDFLLFGASAYFTEIECPQLPALGSLTSCSTPIRYPGGPTVELALAIATKGCKVTLVSSVGNDQDGWSVISDLINNNVDVADIVVEEGKRTNETIVVREDKGHRTLVGVSDLASLSITSPSQVPWSKFANADLIYIGEVFIEVAVSIAAYAKSRDIPVIYRCSVPFLELGLDQLEPILQQIDWLILSNRAWRFLKDSHGEKTISELRKHTDSTMVVKSSKKSYKVYELGARMKALQTTVSTPDISEWFVAGLLTGLKQQRNTLDSIRHGIESEIDQKSGSTTG